MIYVFYHKRCNEKLEAAIFNDLLHQLPAFVQAQALSYRKMEDRQRCVIGKHLLMVGLRTVKSSHASLTQLKYTENKRPYLDSNFDFNISHSNEFTICAVTEEGTVGIDIEEIQPVDIKQFESQFSTEELNHLESLDDINRGFFCLWTQKEAFVKAIGKGLLLSLNQITIKNKQVTWENGEWFLHELKLHDNYFCHLCTSSPSPTIVVKEVVLPIANDSC